MNVFVSRIYPDTAPTTAKARTDVEQILLREGYLDIGIGPAARRGGIRLSNLRGTLRAARRLNPGDRLLLQYPMGRDFDFLAAVAHRKGATVTALVHDLLSAHHPRITAADEASTLSSADRVIATNARMASFLQANGLTAPVTHLGLWDYLGESRPLPTAVSDHKIHIAYAGSLSPIKNRFLYSWGSVIDGYVADIYGRGFRMSEAASPQCFYNHGHVPAELLISGMTADYGLVWDGDSIDGCTGRYGSYLSLNTPHKLSLYIRAALPVIVWEGAAVAQTVKDEGIGLTVDTLRQIPERLAAVTEDEYNAMKRNVERLSALLADGHYLKSAL